MRPHAVSKKLRLCLTLFLFSLTVSTAMAQESSSDILKHVKHAVVLITTYDKNDKPLLQGSGFFIESTRLITSLHVLKDAQGAKIKTFDGKTFRVKGIVAMDEVRDLALIEVGDASPGCTILAIEEITPTEGEQIIVVSNPQGSSWKVSKGIFEARWDFQSGGELLRITASIFPGSSGGPVVNQQGRVVGIATLHIDSSDDLNFALPGEFIKTLIRGPLLPLSYRAAQVL